MDPMRCEKCVLIELARQTTNEVDQLPHSSDCGNNTAGNDSSNSEEFQSCNTEIDEETPVLIQIDRVDEEVLLIDESSEIDEDNPESDAVEEDSSSSRHDPLDSIENGFDMLKLIRYPINIGRKEFKAWCRLKMNPTFYGAGDSMFNGGDGDHPYCLREGHPFPFVPTPSPSDISIHIKTSSDFRRQRPKKIFSFKLTTCIFISVFVLIMSILIKSYLDYNDIKNNQKNMTVQLNTSAEAGSTDSDNLHNITALLDKVHQLEQQLTDEIQVGKNQTTALQVTHNPSYIKQFFTLLWEAAALLFQFLLFI